MNLTSVSSQEFHAIAATAASKSAIAEQGLTVGQK